MAMNELATILKRFHDNLPRQFIAHDDLFSD